MSKANEFEDRVKDAQSNVLEKIKKHKVEFIYFQFSDIQGHLRSSGYATDTEELKSAFKKGRAFDGSSILGLGRTAESDKYLIPDPGIEFLPYSLSNALEYLKLDEVVINSLGGAYSSFLKAKEQEILKYQHQITPVEYELYL